MNEVHGIRVFFKRNDPKIKAYSLIELGVVLVLMGFISTFALSNIRDPQDTIETNRFEDYLQRLNASSAHYTKLIGAPPEVFSDFIVEEANQINKNEGLFLNLLQNKNNEIICEVSSLSTDTLECDLNTSKKIASYTLENGIITVTIEDK